MALLIIKMFKSKKCQKSCNRFNIKEKWVAVIKLKIAGGLKHILNSNIMTAGMLILLLEVLRRR